MLYIGLDVGKKGGIVALDENKQIICIKPIPLIKNKEIDIYEIVSILKGLSHKYDVQVVGIEDVHSMFGSGAKANFQFGRCLGILEGITVALNLSYMQVNPKKWQSVVWEGIRPIKINTGKKTKTSGVKYKIDTKATSLLAAKRLFPNQSFLATDRSKVPHDGIVDALLIAEYCRKCK